MTKVYHSIREAHAGLLSDVECGRRATRPRPPHMTGEDRLVYVRELPPRTVMFEVHDAEVEELKRFYDGEITERQDRRQLREELIASWLGHTSREGLYTRRAFVHAGAGDCPIGVGVICSQVVPNLYVYEVWMPIRSLDVRLKALADFAFAASLVRPIIDCSAGSPGEKLGFVNIQVQNAHVYV